MPITRNLLLFHIDQKIYLYESVSSQFQLLQKIHIREA